MMTNASVLTFGTTNHTRLGELTNALVAPFGALTQGSTPEAAVCIWFAASEDKARLRPKP